MKVGCECRPWRQIDRKIKLAYDVSDQTTSRDARAIMPAECCARLDEFPTFHGVAAHDGGVMLENACLSSESPLMTGLLGGQEARELQSDRVGAGQFNCVRHSLRSRNPVRINPPCPDVCVLRPTGDERRERAGKD